MNPIKSEDELRDEIADIIKRQPAPLLYENMFPEAQEEVDGIMQLIKNLQSQHERELVEAYKEGFVKGQLDKFTVLGGE